MTQPQAIPQNSSLSAAERARLQRFLRLPMSERLHRGVEFSRFALRNVGAARRAR